MNRDLENLKAPRKCLRCGKKFMSEGPWNRLCRRCKEKISSLHPFDEEFYR